MIESPTPLVISATLASANEETGERLDDEVQEGEHRLIVRELSKVNRGFRPPRAHPGAAASDRTLRVYAEHDIRGRPHRALGLTPPLAAAAEPVQVSPRDVRRRDLLGGIIHQYHGLAA